MFSEMLIIFESFNNHIEHISTDAEISLRECNEIFAVIRINPHTILQSHEPVFLHKSTETYSHAFASLGNIKSDNAPSSIPSSLLCYRYFFGFHL